MVLVAPDRAAAEGRGDVVRRQPALAHGVLRGHGGDLAGPRQVRHGSGVTAGQHLRMSGRAEIRVHDEAAVARLDPERLDEGIGPDADAPDQRPGPYEGAVAEV